MADLEARRGDSFRHYAVVYDAPAFGGSAVRRDLSGHVLATRLRWADSPLADAPAAQLAAEARQPPLGVVVLSLPADHGLAAGTYSYEVDLTAPDGFRETILDGRLAVLDSLFA